MPFPTIYGEEHDLAEESNCFDTWRKGILIKADKPTKAIFIIPDQ